MLKNYLLVSIRNLKNNKIIALINVSGLAVGMASVILIALYVSDELSYDSYHTKADRIYRATVASDGSALPDWVGTPAPLAPAIRERFPEIERYVRVDPLGFKGKALVRYQDYSSYEDGLILADPGLFDVFDFKLLRGDPVAALATRTSLVITESIAEKYFGDQDPIGQILNYDGDFDFTVSGVCADVPENSHFSFQLVASFEFLNEMHGRDIENHWGMWNYYTYMLLRENSDAQALEAKSQPLLRTLLDEPARLHLQPITDIYLRSKIARDPHHRGDIGYVYMYIAIAGLILMIACVNFMNLYTANAARRASEIGMRKVLGARKGQLVRQFLSESFFLAALALPAAVLLVELVLPVFNKVTQKVLDIQYMESIALYGDFLLMIVIVGFSAGSYPAFFLSTIQPLRMLGKRGKIIQGLKSRNVLVIFQFAITIVLIIGSLLINGQMNFIRNKKLGYDRENIVNVAMYGQEARSKYDTFRSEIINHAGVVDATASSFTPSVERWREGMYFEGRSETDDHMFYRISGDFNFVDLFGMEVVSGRTFDRSKPTDRNDAYVLNESAVNEIGWTSDEAVGKAFGSRGGRVVGVVKDFHFRSLRRETQPLVISVMPRMYRYISIRFQPEDIPATLGFLQSKWADVNPGIPFEYYFYETEFDTLYKSEMKLRSLFGGFTFLAIFIACLGLFGLSLFAAQQRRKEIGIRKTLGASLSSIVGLISKDFVKLVILANLIAWPVAYLIMSNWLQKFAYRIDLGWWTFVLAGLSAVVIALMTIGVQAVKSAAANPVDALRYE